MMFLAECESVLTALVSRPTLPVTTSTRNLHTLKQEPRHAPPVATRSCGRFAIAVVMTSCGCTIAAFGTQSALRLRPTEQQIDGGKAAQKVIIHGPPSLFHLKKQNVPSALRFRDITQTMEM